MLEPMTIWVEVWPVAADEMGLWLLSGADSWRDGPVMADNSVDFMVKSLLREHGIKPESPAEGGDCRMVHSTSWRPDGPRQINTYVAAVEAGPVACERWPRALPVAPDLLGANGAGKPPTHGAAEEPVPRWLDVLFHGLGHFKDQITKNGTAREALGELWRVQLEPYEETLAGMYAEPHRAA